MPAADNSELSLLALLDLSAAFDIIDHDILLTRLRVSYGVRGPILDWFRSYLTDSIECIRRCMFRSPATAVCYRVLQESVFGPLLFILYAADLIDIIEAHGLHSHVYADDTQIQSSCCPESVDTLQSTQSMRCRTGCVRIGYS